MGDFIETSSKRSFGREHSFSTWRQSREATQKEAGYGSDFRLNESQHFCSTEVSETRSGSPGTMFKWNARESAMSSSKMMYGTTEEAASRKDHPTITQLDEPQSLSMGKGKMYDEFGTSIGENEGYYGYPPRMQNEQLLITDMPNPPPSQLEPPPMSDPDAPAVAEYAWGGESVKPTFVESPVHATSRTPENTGLDAFPGENVRSLGGFEGGAPPAIQLPEYGAMALENGGESHGKAPWNDADRASGEDFDSGVEATSQGNRLPGTSSQQLPPVMEHTDYVEEDPISVANREVALPSDQISLDSSIGPSRSVSSRECKENMYTLAQRPWGSSVSPNSRASEAVSRSPWIRQSVQAVDIDEVSAPREILQKYKNKLASPSGKMIRLGRLCAKSMWFWVGLIALVAGIEGFNETESATISQFEEGKNLFSDDEDD
ncbi:hypothetical protein BSKO_08587 [Bryopsis sp. KO-2023]|nr:hypothetical protein BSKO_08587 [Bryopsis sp. KO-2023]